MNLRRYIHSGPCHGFKAIAGVTTVLGELFQRGVAMDAETLLRPAQALLPDPAHRRVVFD